MPNHISIVGQTGQLASALIRLCEARNIGFRALSRQDLDLSANDEQITGVLETLEPTDLIIIAAAYTAVDAAEEDLDTAIAVNGDAPRTIANFCKAKNIPLIHVSTDYVFDGKADTPYVPDSTLSPINNYGYSKLLGEQHVLESGANAAIFRTSWVFDGIGKNFLTTMLRLAETREALGVVGDQVGRPTYAGHLAQSILNAGEAAQSDPSNFAGLYHLTGSGPSASWADFAREIFQQASEHLNQVPKVNNILASEYPTPAKRPNFSVLNMDSYVENFTHPMPNWQLGVSDAIEEWVKVKNN